MANQSRGRNKNGKITKASVTGHRQTKLIVPEFIFFPQNERSTLVVEFSTLLINIVALAVPDILTVSRDNNWQRSSSIMIFEYYKFEGNFYPYK